MHFYGDFGFLHLSSKQKIITGPILFFTKKKSIRIERQTICLQGSQAIRIIEFFTERRDNMKKCVFIRIFWRIQFLNNCYRQS